MNLRRVISPAVLAAVVLMGAAAADASAKKSMLVVGDSLAVGTKSVLPDMMSRFRVSTDAWVGRPTSDGMKTIRARGSKRLPDVLVVSLGTNDAESSASAFRSAINTTVRLAGPQRCVVWLNVSRPSSSPTGGNGRSLNRVLAQEARDHRNLVVVDWAGYVRSGKVHLDSLGLHPDHSGYVKRARLIANAVRDRCGSATAAKHDNNKGKRGAAKKHDRPRPEPEDEANDSFDDDGEIIDETVDDSGDA